MGATVTLMTIRGPSVPGQPDRPCAPVVIPAGPDGLAALLPPLSAALAGTGPAIALLPATGSPSYRAAIVAAVRPHEPVPPEVAAVASTSGSTGAPAGVLLPGSALRSAAAAFAARTGQPQGHRWVAALPLHHAGGFMVAVRAVIAGTEPVAVDSLGGAGPFTVAGFAEATAAARARSDDDGRPIAVSLVPAMLAAIDAAGAAGWDLLAEFDAVLVGGAATPRALVDRLLHRDLRVLPSYGMTETCGGAVVDGRPLDGVTVSAASDGRLQVCGPQVAWGYRDGRHPERWAQGPGGVRCFVTDDLGEIGPDGAVSVHGRVDDVVQVGGASVSVGAVVGVLRSDPRVAEAHVVAVPDEAFGATTVALVVPFAGSLTEREAPALADLVQAQLGRAARPGAVHLLGAIPMLESGKPDRADLAHLARQVLADRSREAPVDPGPT